MAFLLSLSTLGIRKGLFRVRLVNLQNADIKSHLVVSFSSPKRSQAHCIRRKAEISRDRPLGTWSAAATAIALPTHVRSVGRED